MKKHLLPLVALLLLAGCQTKSETDTPARSSQETSSAIAQDQTKTMTYKDYTAALVPISHEELEAKMASGQPFLLFLGRETCSHCQAFVPKLYNTLQEVPRTVYYYNTEDKTDQNLQAFRDRYGIATVPNLSYYEGDQLVASLNKGSQASKEELVALLNHLAE